ncbi:MAG: hypothetical protein DMD28_05890 [Gemmatimonadetes bacterium]|nr:MAG: hypothetical protein DMD28_05890 [Gemmatimonadota bacterium]
MTLPRGAAALLLGLPGTLVAQNVAEVQVAPPSITVKVGERSGLLATAFDRVGNVIPTVRVFWSSNNIQIARVDNNGTVTGVANGVAIIEARVGSRKGTAAVQVVGGTGPPPPPPDGGQQVTQTPPGTPPSDGSLVGQPPGTGVATVLRLEPPTIYLLPSENVRAAPRALKDDGSAAAPVVVTWRSLRPDIASVDQNGVVVALASGQGTVQITTGSGLTATAPVVVQQTDFVFREQAPITLGPGEADTVRVVVPAQNGRIINPLALQWTSSDPSVARVSLTGVLTAVAPGKATVSVSGLLQAKSIDVVVHRPVELLAVRPKWQDEVLVPIQGTVKFEAQALAADRTPVADAPLQWSLADTSLASFDAASGVLAGRKAGKTQLVVKGPGQGLIVTWTVRVLAASVRLSAARLGLPLNRRYTLKGNYVDSAGAVIGLATALTWASDNPQLVAVADDGIITAVSYGRAQIVATAPGGKRATADVVVQGEIVVASSRSGRFQLYAAERSNLAQLRKITQDTAIATEPAFSPDGSRIAYSSHRHIYLMDADGTNVTRLTNAPATDGRAQFTPDGNAVVFQSDRTARSQIFLQPLSAAEPTQLTQEPAVNSQPTISPDGETIAFVSSRDAGTNVWLMSKDGSNQRAFTKSTPGVRNIEPHFLRDGSLAYLLETKQGGRTLTQVVKADLATGKVTPLTGTDLVISAFALSPSGDLLGLVVNVQGGGKPFYRVYIQPIGTGGAAVPLPTTGAEQMMTPAFMP